jgi:hypothetical protein
MKYKNLSINLLFLALIFSVISCESFFETDTQSWRLVSFFDLRDRESFVQITNTGTIDEKLHVKIFNVNDNCNENNFFDNFTGNDTHVYNMRDITTNDGNPSGVVLPANAYGIVVVTVVDNAGSIITDRVMIGNFRVIDNSGYEYRTNLFGLSPDRNPSEILGSEFTFNFNKEGGVNFSDIIGFTLDCFVCGEVGAADIINAWALFDVEIMDLNENVFSCRNVIFACTDQDNPRLEELLEVVGDASVASFEYGINSAIPHSKGGELLCPGNTIEEGFVGLDWIVGSGHAGGMFVGLNNGNGRGSMDSFWIMNPFFDHGGGDR